MRFRLYRCLTDIESAPPTGNVELSRNHSSQPEGALMKGLGASTDVRYVEGRGHFDLYPVGGDPWGLYKSIAWA